MQLAIASLIAFASTYIGGLFALRFRKQLHAIMGFTAGVILGVVAFDIFPEIIEQVNEFDFNPLYPMIALLIGFFLFHIIEKSVLMHHAHEDEYASHTHPHVGVLSALALIGHSFMDGLGIGLAFQINTAVGVAVALAVIAHDFSDGMNTVALMLHNKNTATKAKIFLLFDALAPILGALATTFFQVPAWFLVLYLGFFAGFLLYIGATDILPEAHSSSSSYKIIALSLLGCAFIFIVTRFL